MCVCFINSKKKLHFEALFSLHQFCGYIPSQRPSLGASPKISPALYCRKLALPRDRTNSVEKDDWTVNSEGISEFLCTSLKHYNATGGAARGRGILPRNYCVRSILANEFVQRANTAVPTGLIFLAGKRRART